MALVIERGESGGRPHYTVRLECPDDLDSLLEWLEGLEGEFLTVEIFGRINTFRTVAERFWFMQGLEQARDYLDGALSLDFQRFVGELEEGIRGAECDGDCRKVEVLRSLRERVEDVARYLRYGS